MTQQTQQIIDSHKVTAATYSQTVEKAGGFNDYVRSLGGIFAELIGKADKVTTTAELRKRCDYVQGLMQIFRFCYWNGSTWWWHQNSTVESFYTTKQTKTCPTGTVEQLASGAGGRTRITNCNYGCDTLAKKCGYSIWSCDYDKMLNAGKKKITKAADLKTGDLVHFFSGTISKKNWRHVAIVYSTEGGNVLLSDYGSRFIKTGKPLHAFPAEYTNYPSWLGVRYMDLEDEAVKDTNDLAVELKREIDGYLAFKRQEAGEDVYSTMSRFRSDRDAYLRAAADYVLDGHAGNGEARQVFFGDDYADVQNKVNWVLAMTRDVIAGIYGTGETRKARLGPDYDVIQAQVNRQLRR